jgi:hypothetical protein
MSETSVNAKMYRPFPLRRYASRFGRSYILELVAIPFLGTATVVIIGLLSAALNPRAGGFVDQISLFPPWPLAIAVGIIFCVNNNRPKPSFAAKFAWLLPFGFLLFGVSALLREPPPYYSRQGWEAMFGHSCGGESCFEPIAACLPSAFAIPYSVTAKVLRMSKRCKNRTGHTKV